MKIGLSSASFYPDINTEDTIGLMKALGFSTGEIFLNSPCEYETEFVELLCEELEKHNFDVVSVHAFSSSFEPYLFDSYERRRRDLMKLFKAVCRAAGLMGAKYYTFHGMRFSDFRELNKKFIVDIYDELTYTACENGILLAQENVSWCMSGDIRFLSCLREACKNPLGFTLDIKQAYKAAIEPSEYIEVMKGALVNVHLNDRDDKNVCLLPGRGKVDYADFFGKLRESGYEGDGIIEVYRSNFNDTGSLTEAMKHLEGICSSIFNLP